MVVIFLLSLCIWVIDIARPAHSLSSLNASIYVLIVTMFVLMDAIKVKSRMFVIFADNIFVLGTINEIYNRTFAGWDQGVVLFKYTIQGTVYLHETVCQTETRLDQIRLV